MTPLCRTISKEIHERLFTLARAPTRARTRPSARVAVLLGLVATTPVALVAQRITVGPNVQISAARPQDAHSEPVIATDPKHPERIIAGSHISWHDTTGTKSIAYVSFDAGKTWALSLERRDSTIGGDAAVAYGPDGSAYFATLARWGVFRSRDGGRTGIRRPRPPPPMGGTASTWSLTSAAASITVAST